MMRNRDGCLGAMWYLVRDGTAGRRELGQGTKSEHGTFYLVPWPPKLGRSTNIVREPRQCCGRVRYQPHGTIALRSWYRPPSWSRWYRASASHAGELSLTMVMMTGIRPPAWEALTECASMQLRHSDAPLHCGCSPPLRRELMTAVAQPRLTTDDRAHEPLGRGLARPPSAHARAATRSSYVVAVSGAFRPGRRVPLEFRSRRPAERLSFITY